MKPKVVHYTDIPAKPFQDIPGVYWRIVIGKDDGAPTYAMRIFEFEPGAKIPLHEHPWEHEIFVIKGKLRVYIGENSYEVSEGYAIFIPPNVKHGMENIGNEKAIIICTIPHEEVVKLIQEKLKS